MYVKQVLNNNTIIALDNNKNEIIVDAKGIGFNAKVDSDIDETKFKHLRKFVLENRTISDLQTIYNNIPQDIMNLSMQLLEEENAEKKSVDFVSINSVLLLADHINETIKRLENGVYLRNSLTNEIKIFYSTEFRIASIAKEKLIDKNVYLNDDEISFIAIHLINLNSNNMNDTMTSIQIVDDLVNIVRRVMNIELKINTYEYSRFITHLKYFSVRILNRENVNSKYDEKLASFVKENYKKAYICSNIIKKYIKEKYDYEITEDEVIYLTLHLENIKK